MGCGLTLFLSFSKSKRFMVEINCFSICLLPISDNHPATKKYLDYMFFHFVIDTFPPNLFQGSIDFSLSFWKDLLQPLKYQERPINYSCKLISSRSPFYLLFFHVFVFVLPLFLKFFVPMLYSWTRNASPTFPNKYAGLI